MVWCICQEDCALSDDVTLSRHVVGAHLTLVNLTFQKVCFATLLV